MTNREAILQAKRIASRLAADAFEAHRRLRALEQLLDEGVVIEREPPRRPPAAPPANDGATAGDELRRIRNTLELSQAAFGRRLGIPQSQISRYELGKDDVPPALRRKAERLLTGRR